MSLGKAPRSVRNWIAYNKPASMKATDENGDEHVIKMSASKRRVAIALATLEELNAVSVRAYDEKGSVLGAYKIRDVEADEPAPVALPATTQGYDITAVVQCVAKEVREAGEAAFRLAVESHKAGFAELTSMVKLLGERHSASEAALSEAREQIIAEREERIDEREDERAQKEDADQSAFVKMLLDSVGPEVGKSIVQKFTGNGPKVVPVKVTEVKSGGG